MTESSGGDRIPPVPARPSSLDLVDGPGAGVVVATGVIDSHTADRLLDHLGSVEASDVALDLAGVDFIDSSGLRAIILSHQRRVDAGGALRLVALCPASARLLEITGLDDHLNIDIG